jgi:hypothetical protein
VVVSSWWLFRTLFGADALVGAVHVAWILIFDDWSAFWRHNVAVNQAMAGSVPRNIPTTVRFWADSPRWPMLSAPLAALGGMARKPLTLSVLNDC